MITDEGDAYTASARVTVTRENLADRAMHSGISDGWPAVSVNGTWLVGLVGFLDLKFAGPAAWRQREAGVSDKPMADRRIAKI